MDSRSLRFLLRHDQSQDGYFDPSLSGALSTPSTSIPTSPVSQGISVAEKRQEELLFHFRRAIEEPILQVPDRQQQPPAAISSSSDLASSSVPVPKVKSRQRGSMSCCQCRKLKKKCEKVGNSKNCFDCLRKGIECSWPENPGNINRRKSKGNVKKVSGSKDKMSV